MAELRRREYKNPPLVEAVAEFRFEPNGGWDQTVPGLVYELLRDEFPEKRQVAALDAQIAGNEGGVLAQEIAPVERLQLRRPDESALVQISPNYLAISRLEPYESWDEYRPLIQRGLTAYRETGSPSGIQRIGLRCVNKIDLPSIPPPELSDFFDFYPHVGPRLPQSHGPFICGIQIPHEDGRDWAKMQLADSPAEGVARFVLDIDYFLNQAGAIGFDDVDGWLESAHERVEDLFEGSITDALRKRFGVVE